MPHPGPESRRPISAADAKGLLKAAIRDPNPVIFLENELLYGHSFPVPDLDDYVLPIGKAAIWREGADVTLVAHSASVGLRWRLPRQLAEQGIDAEVIDLRTIRPMDTATVIEIGEEDQPLRHGVKKAGLHGRRGGIISRPSCRRPSIISTPR
jgi:pyruvate dehydrogenase E1 component beta subunit